MITLKRLNVVRQVATEEQAAKLEAVGFARIGGAAEDALNTANTEVALAEMGEAIHEQIKKNQQDNEAALTTLGEDMFERLNKNLQEAVAKAALATKDKDAKGGKKESQDGGASWCCSSSIWPTTRMRISCRSSHGIWSS